MAKGGGKKPPVRLMLRFCVHCGRDDRLQPLHDQHRPRGGTDSGPHGLCHGPVIQFTYGREGHRG